MRKLLVPIVMSLGMFPLGVHAHGCLKGAAVGGVVGHVAGHHAVAGAAVGCIVGHHRARVRERRTAQPQAGSPRSSTDTPVR
jgi:hypothetical protein